MSARKIYDEEGLAHVGIKPVELSSLDILLLTSVVAESIESTGVTIKKDPSCCAYRTRQRALQRIAKVLAVSQ